MTHKFAIVRAIREYMIDNPEKTFSEVMYSFLRPMGDKKLNGCTSDILKLSDTEHLNRFNKMIKIEENEN